MPVSWLLRKLSSVDLVSFPTSGGIGPVETSQNQYRYQLDTWVRSFIFLEHGWTFQTETHTQSENTSSGSSRSNAPVRPLLKQFMCVDDNSGFV